MGLLLTGTPMSWSPFSSSSSSSSSSTRQACSPLIQLFFGFACESVFVNSTNISKTLSRQRCLSSTWKNHLTSLAPLSNLRQWRQQHNKQAGIWAQPLLTESCIENNKRRAEGFPQLEWLWPAARKPKSCAEMMMMMLMMRMMMRLPTIGMVMTSRSQTQVLRGDDDGDADDVASHNWNGYDQPAACKPKSCAESYKRPPTLPWRQTKHC